MLTTADRTVGSLPRAVLAHYGTWVGGALLGMAFVLPLAPGAAWACAIAAFVLMLVQRLRARGVDRLRPQVGGAAIWSSILYLLHVIGLSWSVNIGFGLFDLDSKAPLLLFALFAMLAPPEKRSRDGLLFVFVIGCATSVVVHIGAAVWRVMQGTSIGAAQEFYSSAFSVPLHPSYLALYLSVAIAAWYLSSIHSALTLAWDLVVFVVLCMGVVLCGSKAGWVALALLLPVLLVMKWRDVRVRTVLASCIVLTGIAVGALVAISPNARDRVQEAWRAAFEEQHRADATTSSEVRWITWSAAWHLFQEAPLLGTGTGDIKDELLRVYTERGNTHALERKLNAHDQFLQTAACLGIPGAVVLIVLLLLPVVRWRRSGALGVTVALLWTMNLVVESMFEVQAGTVFFGFTLLVVHTMRTQDTGERSFAAAP